MKSQLLEDIGENHSLPITPPESVTPAHFNGAPQSAGAATKDKWRAGPWRHRESPAPEQSTPVPAAQLEPTFAPLPYAPPPIHSLDPDPDPLAESWLIANANVAAEPPWHERWGGRAAAWIAGVAALVFAAGAAAWVYQEYQLDQALAVASASLEPSIPVQVTRAPIRQMTPIDVTASELPLLATDFQPGVPDFAPTPAPAKPARKTVRKVVKTPPRRPAPLAPAPAAAPTPESPMAETLRQCRAAGYHAAACVERGCVATPYGIACKG